MIIGSWILFLLAVVNLFISAKEKVLTQDIIKSYAIISILLILAAIFLQLMA